MQKILQGDKGSGEWLVDTWYPPIYRLLYQLTRNTEAAEDLVQQTFAAAWKALENFRGEARLSTWLYRIALREYSAWKQKQPEAVPLECAPASLLTLPAAGLEALALQQAMAALPEQQLQAFLLVAVQQLSAKEAASLLEIPVPTLKSRLAAARQKLRAALSEEMPQNNAAVEGAEGVPSVPVV